MSFSMSGASLSVFELGLSTLSAVLDKAEGFAAAKKIDPTVLLHGGNHVRQAVLPPSLGFQRRPFTQSAF